MTDKCKNQTYLSEKHRKKKKKYSKKHGSSNETDSSMEEQWVEAGVSNSKEKTKKHKKKHKRKYDSSDYSNSGDEMKWVEKSSYGNSKVKKKKKKKKKEVKYSSSSSSSESSANENLKVESLLPSYSNAKREDWMNEELFVPTLNKDEMYVSSRQRRIDSKKQQREEEEKIHKMRELNPHLKDKGTRLPEKNTDVESLSLPSTSVGDGGYSWLKKAYYRIQEQAQAEGRSMEEVAVERWGSLNKLVSLIEEAEARMKSHPDFKKSRKESYDSRDNKYNKRHFKKPSTANESERSFDSPFQFKKPTDNTRNYKQLNKFTSSRKSSHSNYNEYYDMTKNEDSQQSKNQHEERMELVDVKASVHSSTKSDNENHIPAWKKKKYLPDKTFEEKMSDVTCSGISTSNSCEDVTVKTKLEEDKIPIIYSYDDLNELGLKQIEAKLMGDTELAKKYKEQLEKARELVKEKGFAKQPSKKVEEVILTKFDNHGVARPIQTSQEKVESFKNKKVNRNFFDDGSKHSLKQMFEREKLTTTDDHIQMFVEASAHSNETVEIDYESGHISKKLSKKLSTTCEEERDIGKAIQQHQKLTASLEKCAYCIDQPRMKKHLIIEIGEQVYLSLPNFQTLTDGHCLIVPKTHISSFLSLDENEWREVQEYKNLLRNFFKSDNKSVLFLETSMNYRYFPHAIIECIPVPKEDGDIAPFYFKKAIQESETEWAHNKKLIDLRMKGLRHSVPKNLPYFHIEFDPEIHAGFAHVIEDEKYFPRNFGKEVIGGMLDIDYNHLYKNKREDHIKKLVDVDAFKKKWTKFKNIS